ncbi:MAG: hypothetical protein Q4A09_09505 [Capnocytophaga felis]|nr:hypothetical protein [Capnocytophaga felis]
MKKLNSKARVSEVADVAHRLVGQFAQETTLQNDAFLKRSIYQDGSPNYRNFGSSEKRSRHFQIGRSR